VDKPKNFKEWVDYLYQAKWTIIDRDAVLECYKIARERCPDGIEDGAFGTVNRLIMDWFTIVAGSEIIMAVIGEFYPIKRERGGS
jgi:hypothetical protein